MTERPAFNPESAILVTGASGFLGHHVVRELAAHGSVVAAVRDASRTHPFDGVADVSVREIGDVGPETDWAAALRGVASVVHLAARAHVMRGGADDDYWRVNAHGTRRLAEQAAAAGVRRFVLVSTIKVNGEFTVDSAFSAERTPQPEDEYARSKLAAEEALWAVCGQTGMEGVVVRPPLVYGPDAKANFALLVRAIRAGIPLPVGAIQNERSMISVWNLSALIDLLVRHPLAAGRVWLASDGENVSTPGLVRRLAVAMGRPTRMLNVPVSLLSVAAVLTGRGETLKRLVQSLVVDSSPVSAELGFTPVVTLDDGLRRSVAASPD